MRNTNSTKNSAILIAVGIMLSACGGGESSQAPVSMPTQAVRGALTSDAPQAVPVAQSGAGSSAMLAPEALSAILEGFKPGLTQVAGTPKCEVSVYTIKYTTIGGANEATDATAAVMVPGGAACTGPRPVLLYGHGTATERDFNMAHLRDNGEALLVAGTYAAQGFIVVAPNYAGYAGSRLAYHPYLNAEQQGGDMVDAMRAARSVFGGLGARDSGQLFLGGYSQGAHAALATLRAIQKNHGSEFHVTAVGGMSGPYALGMLSDASFGGSPALGGTVFLPMLTRSYQNSYGDIYLSTADVYEAPYAVGLDAVLPGQYGTSGLFEHGHLPQAALFARQSLPGPASSAFAAYFGDGNLVKTNYRNQYLQDVALHACAEPGGCAAAQPLRAAMWRNDLRNFVPAAPVMMCGGKNDPTVFFASTQRTAEYFRQGGISAPTTVLDLEAAVEEGDPFALLKQGFSVAKNGIINRGLAAGRSPEVEVATAYHTSLVPAFCMGGTRAYFQSFLPRG